MKELNLENIENINIMFKDGSMINLKTANIKLITLHEKRDEKELVLEDVELYEKTIDYAIERGEISTSLIQRKFVIGYNRAARIIDQLEKNGIIGPQNGSKPRDVLIKDKSELPSRKIS